MAGPNTYKVVWNFSEANGATFSEVYYATGSNPSQLLILDRGAADGRTNLLARLGTWQNIRVSDVNNPRSTAQRTLGWAGTYTNPENPEPGAPGACLVSNLVGAAGGSRKLWMRGIPNFIVSIDPNSGRNLFGPFTTATLRQFYAGLAQMGYGIRRLNSAPNGRFAITKVDGSANNGLCVVTYKVGQGQIAPNLQAGSRVIIAQADKKQLPGLLGQWTVLDTAASTFTIRYVAPENQVNTTAGGYVKLASYSEVSVFDPAKCSPDHWGTRSTKSPLFHSRGAKRAVRIRTLA